MNGHDEDREDDEERDPDNDEIDLGELGDEQPEDERSDESDAEDPKIELAKARARADALAEENVRLSQRTAAPESERRLEVAPTTKKQSLEDLIDDDFVNEFATDAKGAMKKLARGMDAEVDRRTASAGAPAAVSQGLLVVDSFKQRMRESDAEEYALAIKHFNARVDWMRANNPQAFAMLAQSSPAQVDAALGIEWDAAVGKGERENREKRKADAEKRRAAPAPNLGGSGARGAVGSGGGGSRATKLSAFEEDMVKRGKAAGLSDADCRTMVKEHREEMKQRGA